MFAKSHLKFCEILATPLMTTPHSPHPILCRGCVFSVCVCVVSQLMTLGWGEVDVKRGEVGMGTGYILRGVEGVYSHGLQIPEAFFN